MKRILTAAAALGLMSAPAFAGSGSNGGFATGIGFSGTVGGSGTTSSYASNDGGGAVTGKGAVYATSSENATTYGGQNFGMSGASGTSVNGSGYVTSNNTNGKGGVDYAGGASTTESASYTASLDLNAAAYGRGYTQSNW